MPLSKRVQGWAQNASVALVVATLAVVPLLTPSTPLALQGVKQLLFHLMTLALVGLALCQSETAAGGRLGADRWRRLLGGANLPALLLVVLGGISYLTSAEKALSSTEFLRLTCGVGLYFVVAAFFRGRERLQLLTDVLVGVVILATVLGFVNYQSPTTGGEGIIASFGNRQLFAGFLVLVAPLMLALSFAEQSSGRKVAAQIATVLAFAGLLLAQERSAWIGSLVGLLVLTALIWRYRESDGNLGRGRSMLVVPAVLVVCATGVFLVLSRTAPQIQERAATLAAPGEDASWNERVQQWGGTTRMIAERPLFGWGIGTYPVAQAAFVKGLRPAKLIRSGGPSLQEMAHNEYLQLTAELGLLGLLAYLGVLGAFFATALRAVSSRRSGLARLVLMGAMAGVAAQMVDAVSNPAWRYADVSLFLWALIGLGVAAARRSGAEPRTAPAAAPRRAAWNVARLGWQGAVVFVVGMMMRQAVAGGAATAAVPVYIRPRSAFVTPFFGAVYPGQSIQYRLLVRFNNGQFVTLSGAGSGVHWQAITVKGGPTADAFVENENDTGIFTPLTGRPDIVGKTYKIRGTYTSNGVTVAGIGNLKVPVPFGVHTTGFPRR